MPNIPVTPLKPKKVQGIFPAFQTFQLHLDIGDKVEWRKPKTFDGWNKGRVVSCNIQYADPTDLVCVKRKGKKKLVFIKRSQLTAY